MTRMAKLSASFHAVRRDRSGVAAAEFAVIATVMLTVLLGVFDLGNAVQERMQLEQALRAGAQYALSWPDRTTGSTESIQAAITAALPARWTGAVVTVGALQCYCWSSGGGEALGDCYTTCPAGTTKRSYVTLTATNSATPFLLSALTGNSASYVVRFQ